MEKIIKERLISYLDYYDKLNDNQHGFRGGQSTFSQLLEHHNIIIEALEGGNNVDIVYLDMAKAFDTVDHGILLNKLHVLGIRGKVGIWIANFLKDRIQQVNINGELSDHAIVIFWFTSRNCSWTYTLFNNVIGYRSRFGELIPWLVC